MSNAPHQPDFEHHQLCISEIDLHVVQTGPEHAQPIVLLHGWPQDWSSFSQVMIRAAKTNRVIAIDLPGVGQSITPLADGRKRTIAQTLHGALKKLDLRNVVLVGHDIGGQVVYAYLCEYPGDPACAVIMDVVIPGLEPWERVLRNPHIWHFAFHAIPNLPETLVEGRQADYFAWFFDAIAARPGAISDAARARYAAAYARTSALRTGFDWYRAFAQDARDNTANVQPLPTPMLYLRGDHESGNIGLYVAGLRAGGFTNVQPAVIADCGHFAPEEQPEAVWACIRQFMTGVRV